MRSQTNIHEVDPVQVKVRRLFFEDWSNYSEMAINEVDRILDADLPGCWYVNATCCVSSPDPMDEFFDEVARRQGAWCRRLGRHFGKGWRTVRKQSKAPYERGVEFEGVLIIDGKLGLPEDIPEIRRLLGLLPTVILRNQAFHLLKQRKLDELKNLTDEEFRIRQNSDRSAEGYAYFILPHATVESPTLNPAFIEEADRRKSEWHRAVSRPFSRPERRRFFEVGGEFVKLGQFMVAGKRESISSMHLWLAGKFRVT